MADQLRFGFIGCGEIAAQTAQGIAESDHAALVWAMDTNPDLAADLAAKHNAQHTTDADELVSRPEVDVVYIAVPHFLHLPMALKAARAGKHILLEKPTGTHSGESAAIVQACRDAGVQLGIAFLQRYTEGALKARELIRQGVLGSLFGTRIAALSSKPESYWQGGYSGRSKSDWRTYKAKAGGGILIMNCVHNLDLMHYMTGLEVERVYSEYGTYHTPVEVEDFITVTLRYTSGAVGSMEAGSSIPGRTEYEQWKGDRIYGTEGQIVFEGGDFRNLDVYTTREDTEIPARIWHKIEFPKGKNTRAAMVEDYSQAVLAGRTPPIPGEAGLAALATITAAYRSRDLGRPVYISEVTQPEQVEK